MNYEKALSLCKRYDDVVAIMYGNDIETTFVPVRIGNSKLILDYLIKSDGKAVLMKLKEANYWLMISADGSRGLFFRAPVDDNRLFNNVIESDMKVADYFKSLQATDYYDFIGYDNSYIIYVSYR